jgi:hypothetical protein
MSTRGFITFVIDGTEKTAYNHSDSYPSWLGVQVLRAIRGECVTPEAVRDLRVVPPDSKPAQADKIRLAHFADLGVSTQSDDDWYCLLRETQGDLCKILKAGVIEDAGTFPQDSLFAEWGYVLDLDTMTLDVYKGFQTSPHSAGRFAGRPGETEGYYPVALIATWPFHALPDEAEMAALEQMEDADA